MYDYFVAALRCPECGHVSPADSSTNLQTHLRDDADGRELPVGFEFDRYEVRAEDVTSSGYLPVAPPPADGTATLLETWECPACRAANWAAIELVDGSIVAIEAVVLDRLALARAHFISDQCTVRAAQVSDVPLAELEAGRVDPVATLRAGLPTPP